MSVKAINPNADVIGQRHTLSMNITAAKGLQQVLCTNLGPKGTMKMLVSGAGDVKLTKDGKVLLDEMQLQHPTAAIIARTATAQDDNTGDGTTSSVLFTGELMYQTERYLKEGLHPRILVEGFEAAREATLTFLEGFASPAPEVSREQMVEIARTSLRTKVNTELADHLTNIVVDSIQCIQKDDQALDLHMVEIMHMRHKNAMDTRFINGLVLDHGTRHPDMAKRSENCFILTCNVSLEYEKSEVNAGFYYKNAAERAKLVAAERKFTDDKCNEIIAFKQSICTEGQSFIIINQKGIDPPSLDLLQKAGIVAVRRAKRRNMERLSKACGGWAVNSLSDLSLECLGHADLVYEHVLGEDKYTFVEGCKNATSCTVLVRGPNDHTIRQIKDAIRDGLRAVKNVIEDQKLVIGAGAFELAAHYYLVHAVKPMTQGRAKLGVQAFADALLVIPKTLLQNSGLDAQSCLIALLDEVAEGKRVGLCVDTGKPILPGQLGVWDCYRVKRQLLHLGAMIACKLLLVDEVIRAGRKMG
jgi:T-complex protein 1 subunit zeta